MAKYKMTIEETLKKRKYKIPSNLTWWAYAVLARSPFFGPKYHVHYEKIDDPRDCKTGCFIIWNHQSRRDYLFLKNLIAPKKFNMVAGYNEFFRKKFAWIFEKAQVLPKKNFTSDPVGVRAISTIIKQGGCVAFSPEGTSSIYGHNQPIVPGTGRFLQFFRVPVYVMHLEGSYLTSHKVCIDDRPGRVNASIRLMFTPEQLKEMTPEQIDNAINEEFRFDDYEWNKTARVKYKTKGKPCTNLDYICYKCPKCGEEMCIEAHDNIVKCQKCGNGCHINDYYDMLPFDDTCKIPVSPSAWFDWERISVINEIRNNKDYSLSFKVKMGKLPDYKPIKDNAALALICGKGTFTIDHQGLHYQGTKDGEEFKFDVNYDIYYTLSIENDLTEFSVYVGGKMYEFFPLEHIGGKAMMVTEEMHRLHFNYWKNFPWFAYMYHGTELEVENDNYEEEVKKLFLN